MRRFGGDRNELALAIFFKAKKVTFVRDAPVAFEPARLRTVSNLCSAPKVGAIGRTEWGGESCRPGSRGHGSRVPGFQGSGSGSGSGSRVLLVRIQTRDLEPLAPWNRRAMELNQNQNHGTVEPWNPVLSRPIPTPVTRGVGSAVGGRDGGVGRVSCANGRERAGTCDIYRLESRTVGGA